MTNGKEAVIPTIDFSITNAAKKPLSHLKINPSTFLDNSMKDLKESIWHQAGICNGSICVIKVDSCAALVLVLVLFDGVLASVGTFESASFETCDWTGGIANCVDALLYLVVDP